MFELGAAALVGMAGTKLFSIISADIQELVSSIVHKSRTKAADTLVQTVKESRIDSLLRTGVLDHLSEFGFSDTVRDQLAEVYKLLYSNDSAEPSIKLRVAADNIVELWNSLENYKGNKHDFLEAAVCSVAVHSQLWSKIPDSVAEKSKMMNRAIELGRSCTDPKTGILAESPVLQLSLCTAVSENLQQQLFHTPEKLNRALVTADIFADLHSRVKEVLETSKEDSILSAATFRKHETATGFLAIYDENAEEFKNIPMTSAEIAPGRAETITALGKVSITVNEEPDYIMDAGSVNHLLFENLSDFCKTAEKNLEKVNSSVDKALVNKSLWQVSKAIGDNTLSTQFKNAVLALDTTSMPPIEREFLRDFSELQESPAMLSREAEDLQTQNLLMSIDKAYNHAVSMPAAKKAIVC